MVTNRSFPCGIFAGALALAALGACSQSGVVVSRVGHAHAYDPMEISAAGAGGRQIPVVVIGNPFPEPKAAVDAALVQKMQRTPIGIPIDFSLYPTETDPQRPYRVVVVFNPPRSTHSGDVCKAGNAAVSGATQPEGRVAAMGVFCSRDFELSHAFARAPATSARSPAFEAMISQLTFAMFPSRNPHEQTIDLDMGPTVPVP